MTLNIIKKFMTENDCFKTGRTITPKGLMLHSTATPGIMAAAWFPRWNKPNLKPAKCVHAFLDDKGCYQYLPWNHRGWHGGGKSNDTHIGIEWCEPKDLKDKTYFAKVWANGVELYAMLCKMYNLKPSAIIGHYEGYKLGIASNHADPQHWFKLHGKTMDDFRADVAKALQPKPAPPKPAPAKPAATPKPFLIRVKANRLYYYTKPDWNAKAPIPTKKGTIFTVVQTLTVAGSRMYKLKSGTYITANPKYVEIVK